MLRKASEAVPEGNGPVPQKEELRSGRQPMTEGVYRMIKEALVRWDKMLNEISDKMDQHLIRLEHGARQPRLATEADGQADTRTRERTEGATIADDSVVECGAAAFESCLPSMEMPSSTAAGGLAPTGEASTALETTINEPPLRFCPTEETDLEPTVRRLRLHTPYTTAAASSRRGTCLLLHTSGGSLTRNQGKIGPLIQAVLEVNSAPTRF